MPRHIFRRRRRSLHSRGCCKCFWRWFRSSMGLLSSILLTVFIAVCSVLVKVLIVPRFKFAAVSRLPGPPRHWLWGNVRRDLSGEESYKIHVDLHRRYGPMYRFWMGPAQCFVHLAHPRAVRELLKSQTHLKKSLVYQFLLPWLHESVLVTHGEDWRQKRRLLTPAFHFKMLNEYTGITNEEAHKLVQKLRTAGTDYLDIAPVILSLTLDVIGRAAFGVQLCAQEEKSKEYMEAVHVAARTPVTRMLRPLYHYDFFWLRSTEGKEDLKAIRVLHATTEKVVKQRREELAAVVRTDRKYRDLLDILMEARDENNNPLSDEFLYNEVNTFLFAGHDTTATGIMWTLHYLGLYPDIQKKAQEEVDAVFADNTSLTHEDLSKFEYLSMVINESHRIMPPVPGVSRELEEDLCVEGFTIPKGTVVSLRMYALHRLPEFWPDPERFDPERFSKEACANRDPFAFIPFSAGPRNCIGQHFAQDEERIVLATLLHNFHIRTDPAHDPGLDPRLVMAPRRGLRVAFIPRQK